MAGTRRPTIRFPHFAVALEARILRLKSGKGGKIVVPLGCPSSQPRDLSRRTRLCGFNSRHERAHNLQAKALIGGW
jgi:hypothetical protein